MTTQDLKRAAEVISNYNSDYSVRLSIDEEYLILTKGNLDIFHDSACEDTYDVDMAIELFKSEIDNMILEESVIYELSY